MPSSTLGFEVLFAIRKVTLASSIINLNCYSKFPRFIQNLANNRGGGNIWDSDQPFFLYPCNFFCFLPNNRFKIGPPLCASLLLRYIPTIKLIIEFGRPKTPKLLSSNPIDLMHDMKENIGGCVYWQLSNFKAEQNYQQYT